MFRKKNIDIWRIIIRIKTLFAMNSIVDRVKRLSSFFIIYSPWNSHTNSTISAFLCFMFYVLCIMLCVRTSKAYIKINLKFCLVLAETKQNQKMKNEEMLWWENHLTERNWLMLILPWTRNWQQTNDRNTSHR